VTACEFEVINAFVYREKFKPNSLLIKKQIKRNDLYIFFFCLVYFYIAWLACFPLYNIPRCAHTTHRRHRHSGHVSSFRALCCFWYLCGRVIAADGSHPVSHGASTAKTVKSQWCRGRHTFTSYSIKQSRIQTNLSPCSRALETHRSAPFVYALGNTRFYSLNEYYIQIFQSLE